MADNSTQGGNDTIRDIDKSGVKTPVSALDIGGAGVEKLLSADNRMPVAIDEMIYLLNAILEKMPRVDVNDRMTTNIETGTVVIGSGTVTAVTTVATVSNQTNIGGRDASHATFALANMSALHIYNNIQVTA